MKVRTTWHGYGKRLELAVSIMARVVAVLLIAAGIVLMLPLRPAAAATVNIPVGDFFFCSATFSSGVCPMTVNQGDTVEWDFTGAVSHTTTECGGDNNCDNLNPTPLWDSGIRNNGQSFSRIFNTPGTFLYQCTIHTSSMRGQITVVAAGVGGVTQLSGAAIAPLKATNNSDGHGGLFAGLAAAITALAIVGAGGAMFAARRILR